MEGEQEGNESVNFAFSETCPDEGEIQEGGLKPETQGVPRMPIKLFRTNL